MSKELHLTSGPILPQLLQLCLPLLCANVLQQLYNIINSLVVTRYIGDSAFAALGVAESVMNLFIYVITGACMGASVLIAQFYGEQNLPRLRQQLYVSAVLIGGCTLAAVTIAQLFLPQLLSLIQTPKELMGDVALYLRVILVGMLFTFTYNYLAATLRAVGDTKSALYFLLLSLGYNLAAAWLLVAVLNMGILGTALATASAQLLSSGLCFVYIRKKRPFLAVHRADMRMDPVLIHRTSSYAAVAALQQSSLYLGKLMIQSAVNGISLTSTAPISAFTAATRVENFTQAFGISGCESIAIFVAQNQGAAKRLSPGRGPGHLHRPYLLRPAPPVRPRLLRRLSGGRQRGAGAVQLLSAADGLVLLAVLHRTHLCGLVSGHWPDEHHLLGHHHPDHRPGGGDLPAGEPPGAGCRGPGHRPGLDGHRPVPADRICPGAKSRRHRRQLKQT